MKKTTQTYKAQYLGIAQSYMNQIFTGKKPVSWKLAHKLSERFPQKNIEWWKMANPSQIETFLDYVIPVPVTKQPTNKTSKRKAA
jgi:plasmid maintenance system antidote protein VapI